MKYLMVCLGNICRSPMAEEVLRNKLFSINARSVVDSCGFEHFHVGDLPDPRTIETLERHGIKASNHRARLFQTDDFDDFDLILVMDKNNYRDVMSKARNESDKIKVDYLLNFIDIIGNKEVPDPYYGGMDGFEHAFELISTACDSIIEKFEKKCSKFNQD